MTEFARVLERFDPISLAELNAQAELMARVDRKYFVPRELLASMLDDLAPEFQVLEIDGRRTFRYRTVYFDDHRFGFFRQHVQRRRHRFKVRTRTYCESGLCMLEVKSKGYRGQTVKKRIPHDPARPEAVGPHGRAFIESITGSSAAGLTAVVETDYRRATLRHDDQRVTCDIDLACVAGEARHEGPRDVLVETKSSGDAGPLDRALLGAGVRPHSVSKYCVAAALLYPELPSNDWHRTLRRYFGVDPAVRGRSAEAALPLGS